MQKEELKALVKKYFNLTEINNSTENNEQVTEQNFAEATLADGTKITNMEDADFAVGQVLHVITEEGEHVLAPSGEHTTESGIVITVDGEGIITGVKHPDSEGEGSLEAGSEEMAAEEKTEMAEDEVIDEEILEEEGDIKEAIIEAIAEVVMPEVEAMKAKLAEHEEKLAKYEEKMSKALESTPAAKSVTESKFGASKKDANIWSYEAPNFKKAHYAAVLSRSNNK